MSAVSFEPSTASLSEAIMEDLASSNLFDAIGAAAGGGRAAAWEGGAAAWEGGAAAGGGGSAAGGRSMDLIELSAKAWHPQEEGPKKT